MRLRALTIVGITPSTAATKVYGEANREGQSPFALAVGNQFERTLTQNGAALLLELYRSAGRLQLPESKIVNIPELVPGNPSDAAKMAAAMLRRRTETDRLLRMKLRGDPNAPNLIIKPRLTVQLVGVEHPIEPDVLVAADNDRFYRPVEVKSYADRDGKTEAADIRSACRQAAVGAVGVRHALLRFGIDDMSLVPPNGDLIFKKPGSMKATLREMTLRSELASLERAIDEAPRNLDELQALIEPNGSLDSPDVLDQLPNNYCSSCREHCALAARCKQEAIKSGDPAILGDRARELFASVGTVSRALDLLRGNGAPARTAEETALSEQLREAHEAYRKAI
jgi:hypothetical protein